MGAVVVAVAAAFYELPHTKYMIPLQTRTSCTKFGLSWQSRENEVHRTAISCTSCGRTEREGHEREVRLEVSVGVQAGRFPETLPYDDFQETLSQPPDVLADPQVL